MVPTVTVDIIKNVMYCRLKQPNYKGCIGDNKVCGKRILGSSLVGAIRLEARVQCFCGNSYDVLGSKYCSDSCPGNNSQICGSSWVLILYV
jgi:hypothetical protein